MDCLHTECYMETLKNDTIWIRCEFCARVRMVIPLSIRPQRPLARHRLLTFTQELEHRFQDVEDYAEIAKRFGSSICDKSSLEARSGG